MQTCLPGIVQKDFIANSENVGLLDGKLRHISHKETKMMAKITARMRKLFLIRGLFHAGRLPRPAGQTGRGCLNEIHSVQFIFIPMPIADLRP